MGNKFKFVLVKKHTVWAKKRACFWTRYREQEGGLELG